MHCPVCLDRSTVELLTVDRLDYWRCECCQARFLNPSQLPDLAVEKREYDRHENDPDDPGYRKFLRQLAEPLLEHLEPKASGLDYGCGPGPALARMLEEAGHSVATWDPIYVPDDSVLKHRYDFITCTEVVEHFHNPATEFKQLDSLLQPGGWLGVMTRFQTDDSRFANWHYRRDPTHVVFYREATFEWLGKHYGWEVECIPPQVVLVRKR